MSRRVAALFLTALFGVLVVVGIVMAELGVAAFVGYCVTALVGLAFMIRQARRMRPPPVQDGRTCSCCTSTVFDPIEII